jgi:hypothetical protein
MQVDWICPIVYLRVTLVEVEDIPSSRVCCAHEGQFLRCAHVSVFLYELILACPTHQVPCPLAARVELQDGNRRTVTATDRANEADE